ncbi:MAG: tetraacyldisaccharide 4'-kinase, partial [Candidatus Eisenbacteria bacterium]|nr:tetraacyldisaccharide 4'-kinase [Candidatus Eisenbacteria bacterium]
MRPDLSKPPSFPMVLLEQLYKIGNRSFHGLYDLGIRKAKRLPVPVWSVGNLLAGGTGKTPTTLALCQALVDSGKRPVILTRGYRSKISQAVLLGGMHGTTEALAGVYGDEPVLLSRQLPTVPVVIGKDRYHQATQFLEGGGRADVFVLDDGLQHRGLARDRNIVLLPASRPFGNGHQLPAGLLRESPKQILRATHVLVGGGSEENARQALEVLRDHHPQADWRFVYPGLERVERFASGKPSETEAGGSQTLDLKKARVHAVCGIANPNRFRELLEGADATVTNFAVYPDHHAFEEAEVRKEESAAKASGAVLVTTGKDAVRLERLVNGDAPWY